MKKIFLALFVLTLVTIAALKGSLFYLTQQFVDNQITQAKPFVQISYKDIETSLTGTATVHKLKAYIPSMDESIRIESVKFIAPDLLSLMTLDSQLQKKQVPESLSLVVEGVSIDLNGNIMQLMDNPDAEPSQIEVFSTLACGDVYRIGSKALLKMGYEELVSDLILSYQFMPRKNILSYNIQYNIRDMTRFNVSGDLSGISNLDSLIQGKAQLGKLLVEIIDDSYIERKNRFCANQQQQEVADYINEHTQKVKEYLASFGVIPEEGLLNAYKKVLETPGVISFEADLSKLNGLEEIKTFMPNDLIQFVHLKLYVDGKRINEISIDIDKDKLVEVTTREDIQLETPDQIEKKKALIIKKYRPVAVNNLKNFNGYRVRIETLKGKKYKGTINTSNPVKYEVISRMRSGNISYLVHPEDIKSAQVFF